MLLQRTEGQAALFSGGRVVLSCYYYIIEICVQVDVLSAREGDITNPSIKQLSVTLIETKRVFQTTCHSSCPPDDPQLPAKTSASVWVVLYPGTCVYRWNVDNRKIEAKFDASLHTPDNEREC